MQWLFLLVALIGVCAVAFFLHCLRITQRQLKAFEDLTRGRVLTYRYASAFAFDEANFYTVGFHHLVDGKPQREMPPARFAIGEVAAYALFESRKLIYVTLTIRRESGQTFDICIAPGQKEVFGLYEAVKRRLSSPAPADARNAPTPLLALLRTIAATEHDAWTFTANLQKVSPQASNVLLLREAATPRGVFDFDWKVEPDIEGKLSRIFAPWNVALRFQDMGSIDMPELLMRASQAADRTGLKLWLIDTRSDFYAGFLTPKDRTERVMTLCRQCGIPLLN